MSKNLSEEVITRIFDQLDDIKKDVSSINVTLAKQEVTLDEHIRRTALNETHIATVETELKQEISPLKVEIAKFTGMLKISVGIISVIAVAAEVIQAVYAYLGK